MPFIPCFLCGRKLEKRTSKRKKPYFCCDFCGVQTFVRRKSGIERLEQCFRSAEEADIHFRQYALNFHEIQAILKEIANVKNEFDKVDSWFLNDHKLRIRNALKTRLETLYRSLERFAEDTRVRTHVPKSVEM